MRPLLITTEPASTRQGSGTAVAVDGLAAALALHGVHLSVARAAAHPLGHTVTRLRERRSAPLVPAYDVVLGVNGDGHARARRAGIPFVALPKALYAAVVPHETGLTRVLIRRHATWEREGCRTAAMVIAPSAAAAHLVTRLYGVAASRIEVVPEPFAAAAWRDSLPPCQREGRRVLVVAHLYARKRAVDVLAAWPRVRELHPDALLDVAGDGPGLAEVRRRAARLHGVTVHGHVEGSSLRDLYARADVFVAPSAHETFGYAVLEALASGLPVVAGSAPAVRELLEAAEARVVDDGDVMGIARGITSSLSTDVAAAAAQRNPVIASRSEPVVVGAAYVDLLERVRSS